MTIPCLLAGLVIGQRGSRPDSAADSTAACEYGSVVPSGSRAPWQAKDSSSVSDTGDIESDGPIDLYGNPVTDAVADYRLDSAGSLYESHSPQTEIPKLQSPKS